MTLKRKSQKRAKLDSLYANSVKIKCCFCDIKETCSVRASKEKSEAMGITTFCTLTPNKTKSFIKKQKKSKV